MNTFLTFLSRLTAVTMLALPAAIMADDTPAEAAILKRLHKLDATATRDSAGQVTFVQFGCGSLLRDDDLLLMAAFPKLERLTIIGEDDISDAGVEHLKGLKVKRLMIVSEKLTVTSAEHLAALTDLEVLELKEAPLTAEWLTHLKKLPDLRTLKLRDAHLKDADAKAFGGFPKLATLQIRASGMTTVGIESVRVLLPKVEVTQ